MLSVDKSPQQIILHVGTNNLRDHTLTMVAVNIVDLPRKIEMKTLKLSYRSWCQDQTIFQTMLWKLLTRAVWNTVINDWRMIRHQNIDRNCLNKSGLHLDEKGNNIFLK